jgi:hypothetical protein
LSEDLKSDHSEDGLACVWCGRPLLPEELESGWVCWRCVSDLRDKGLSDEEIFAPPEKK